jgi:hypothetical protein
MGYWLTRQLSDIVLLYLHHHQYLKGKSYLHLYDIMDTEISFGPMIKEELAPKSYAEFLKLHARARPKVVGLFKHNMNAIKKSVLLKVIFFILIPSIVFMEYWYLYILTSFTVVLTGVFHERFINNRSFTFQSLVMQGTILSEFLTTENDEKVYK